MLSKHAKFRRVLFTELRKRAVLQRPRRSINPATMLPSCRCCFRRLHLRSQKRPNARQPKNRSPDRNETQRSSRHQSYNYLYAPNSEVFHCRSCKQLLRVKELLGSVYYQTASQNRRPCKLCHPDLQPIIDRPLKETCRGGNRKVGACKGAAAWESVRDPAANAHCRLLPQSAASRKTDKAAYDAA